MTTQQREEDSRVSTTLAHIGVEFIGTAIICLTLYFSFSVGFVLLGSNLALIALATGLVYAGATLAFGAVSGGHFNPAVTVASMLTNGTKILEGLGFIIAQICGAIAAGFTARWLLPVSEATGDAQAAGVTHTIWMQPGTVNGFGEGSVTATSLANAQLSPFGITAAIIIEVLATMVIVATAVRFQATRSTSNSTYAIAMGVAYAAGSLLSYPVTGASLNPARSTGIAVAMHTVDGFTVDPLSQVWVFWLSSILAAALVALPIVLGQVIANAQPAYKVPKTKKKAKKSEKATPVAEAENATVEAETSDPVDEATKTAESDVTEEEFSETEQTTEESVENSHNENADISDDQSNTQSESDENIERN